MWALWQPSPPDPVRPSQKDDNVKAAKRTSFRRATRRNNPRLPKRIPNNSAHSGTTEETREKSSACKVATGPARETSFLQFSSSIRPQLFRDRIKRPSYVFVQHRKFQLQHRLLRIDHDVQRIQTFDRLAPQPNRFAKAPLDPVSLDRAAEHAPHREAHANDFLCFDLGRATNRNRGIQAPQIKHRHMRGKLTPPLLVYAFEIGMFQQSRQSGTTRHSLCRGLV